MEQHDPWSPDEKELARREMRRQRLSHELGKSLPKWRDEALAPAVDDVEIQALLDRQLGEERRTEIFTLILQFRSWAEAYCKAALERRPSLGTD